jgi:hypothetical protein
MARAVPDPGGIRSWRDIPQPVSPRVMSRGGRWRRLRRTLRVLLLAGAVAGRDRIASRVSPAASSA